jgi:hypothetical protein
MRARPLRAALGALLALAGAASATPLLATGCGGSGSGGSGGDAGTGNTTTLHPDAPPLAGETTCTVTEVTEIPVSGAMHVPVCTPISYPTNPPSGGDHWPIWAAYRTYDAPVRREMYVHDLEHGAIVLAYRCKDDCPEVVAALSSVIDGMTADPACEGAPGPSARMVLTPDPDLPTPIAAAAWGAIYTATCIDLPSLQAFAKDHYAQGPEDICANGVDVSNAAPCTGSDAGADGGDAAPDDAGSGDGG